MSGEEWRPVPGHPKYEVSNLGRVRSYQRGPAAHMMKPSRAGKNYRYVGIWSDGKAVGTGVHVLVLAAFVGPRPDGMVTRHLDGDPTNNVLSNLAYGTQSQNVLDTLVHGTNFEANKTHCKRGHEFTEENTINRTGYRSGNPVRACRTCVRAERREWIRAYRLRKQQANA